VTHGQCFTTYGHLPSLRASPPFDWCFLLQKSPFTCEHICLHEVRSAKCRLLLSVSFSPFSMHPDAIPDVVFTTVVLCVSSLRFTFHMCKQVVQTHTMAFRSMFIHCMCNSHLSDGILWLLVIFCSFNSGGATLGRTRSNWLEHPLPWLRSAYCFASVIVWTENKNVTISDRFICFILTVKQSAALAACVLRAATKKGRQFFWGKSAPPEKILATPLTLGVLGWGFSDLEMTWLFYCAGAATGF